MPLSRRSFLAQTSLLTAASSLSRAACTRRPARPPARPTPTPNPSPTSTAPSNPPGPPSATTPHPRLVQPGQVRHLHPLGPLLHPRPHQRVVHPAHVHLRRRVAHPALRPARQVRLQGLHPPLHRPQLRPRRMGRSSSNPPARSTSSPSPSITTASPCGTPTSPPGAPARWAPNATSPASSPPPCASRTSSSASPPTAWSTTPSPIPKAGLANDQFDPRYAGFYGPPIPGDMNDGGASQVFQEDWLARVQELIDKYQPQLIYFDNGVNPRVYDPIKLRAAAYYFNRAAQVGQGSHLRHQGLWPTSPAPCRTSKSSSAPQVDLPVPPGSRRRHRQHLGLHRIAPPDVHPHPRLPSSPSSSSIASHGRQPHAQRLAHGRRQHPRRSAEGPPRHRRMAQVQRRSHLRLPPLAHPRRRPRHPHRVPARLEGRLHRRPDQRHQRRPRPRASRSPRPASASPPPTATSTPSATAIPLPAPPPSNRSPPHSAKVERVTLLGPTPQPVTFKQTAEALVVTMPAAPPITGMPYTLRIEGSQGLGSQLSPPSRTQPQHRPANNPSFRALASAIPLRLQSCRASSRRQRERTPAASQSIMRPTRLHLAQRTACSPLSRCSQPRSPAARSSPASMQYTQVRFIDASPDAPALDIYQNAAVSPLQHRLRHHQLLHRLDPGS